MSRPAIITLLVAGCASVLAQPLFAQLPEEPVEIGTTPQFFVDNYIVDNVWAIKYKSQFVTRVFHAPRKHPANPLIAGDGGYVNVVYDEQDRLFRMWWQTAVRRGSEEEKTQYAIAYAESKDGVAWEKPNLGLFQWQGSKDNNIVYLGYKNSRASGPQILTTIPESQKRGYRYIMTYRTGGAGRGNDGIRLVGSHDGIQWDESSDTLIKHLHSDTVNSIVYDSQRDQYVMTCRAKHLYRLFQGDVLDTGESRRVARIVSKELWAPWEGEPQNILLPDNVDLLGEKFDCFYGMPLHYHAGIYWGFLWMFKMNDPIYTQLATSRDSIHWTRLHPRPALVPLGSEGEWDAGMTFGGPWVEVGDEWRFYYAGHSEGHQSRTRIPGIGLSVAPKERLVSMHGPAGGGVVVTRQIFWPGGDLVVNCDASAGQLKVRVSGDQRKPIAGFDYADGQPFRGDSLAHTVRFGDRSLDELRGQPIRLEFYLENAHLFAFRAESE
jgi:hypothetical protein